MKGEMKMKKTIAWGSIITIFVLGIYFLFGGYNALAMGPHGHGPDSMGPRGGFGGGRMIEGPHHGGGISLIGFFIFLIIGIVIVMFLMKWLRKKSQTSSMQQIIDTSLMSSHKPMNQDETILDQWERNLTTKKEND